MLVLMLLFSPTLALAQSAYPPPPPEDPNEPAANVRQYDLSGPRAGITMSRDGRARSQFGWHFEHQATPATPGPWFVVETILLAGGVEDRVFVPSGTLVFGMRLPNGYEFGIGPSASLGGPRFLNSSLVVAAGRSFRFGGISVPVNLAVATDHNGSRFSIITGWAIRERPLSTYSEPEGRPRRTQESQ